MSKAVFMTLALATSFLPLTASAADTPEPEAALALGGATTFLVGYVPAVSLAVSTALADHPRHPCTDAVLCLQPATVHADGVVLAAPILGPLMLAKDGSLKDDALFSHGRPSAFQTNLLYVDAALQGAGVASATAAVVTALVRDHRPQRAGELTLVPSGTTSQPGLSVVGTF